MIQTLKLLLLRKPNLGKLILTLIYTIILSTIYLLYITNPEKEDQSRLTPNSLQNITKNLVSSSIKAACSTGSVCGNGCCTPSSPKCIQSYCTPNICDFLCSNKNYCCPNGTTCNSNGKYIKYEAPKNQNPQPNSDNLPKSQAPAQPSIDPNNQSHQQRNDNFQPIKFIGKVDCSNGFCCPVGFKCFEGYVPDHIKASCPNEIMCVAKNAAYQIISVC